LGKTFSSLGPSVFVEEREQSFTEVDAASKCESKTSVYFEQTGRTETPVFVLDKLETGSKLAGPALIIDNSESPASMAAVK
jgi:5-oxoprolinase (ATP-hydrolysing)